MEDPTGELANILLHHVYSGSAMSTDLSDGMMIPTLLGTDLTVSIDMDGTVMIDNAMVTVANIEADNGVVHVINAVLIPNTSSINENIINDQYLYTIDLMGRKIKDHNYSNIVIDVYESGQTIKKLIIK